MRFIRKINVREPYNDKKLDFLLIHIFTGLVPNMWGLFNYILQWQVKSLVWNSLGKYYLNTPKKYNPSYC